MDDHPTPEDPVSTSDQLARPLAIDAGRSTPRRARSTWLVDLRRDISYVLPGFPIACIAFVVLVPLTAIAIGTAVIWVGAFLMAFILMIAAGLAELSRARLRAWGGDVAPVQYRPMGSGLLGLIRIVADPRRWLDLAFEVFIAFPLRLSTFVALVVWIAVGVGGVTSILWAWAVPGEPGWIQLLRLGLPDLVPAGALAQHLVHSTVNACLGAVFVVTLPTVARTLAGIDAGVATALLGGRAAPGRPTDVTAGGPPAGDDQPAGAPTPGVAFSGRAWTWAGASALSLVLVAVGWPVIAAVYGVHPAAAMVLVVGHATAVVLAVRWAVAGVGLAAASTAGTMVATADAIGSWPWPWPVTTLLTHCLLVALLGLTRHWVWPTAAWAIGGVLTLVAALMAPGGNTGPTVTNGVVLVSVSAAVAAVGVLTRLWIAGLGRAQRAESMSAEEARRRQALQERNRVARELHDVVAHSLSVISVQASTARYRQPDIDAGVQAEFEDIATASRRALGEMRALLAVLRGDDAAPTTPVPGAAQIAELVEATRASGTPIAHTSRGPDVAPTIGLTAFRVVQESLSNALRHAPGAAIEVTTEVDAERMQVRVRNAPPAAGRDRAAAPGAGLGLAGIHERVTAVGGTVEAEPTPEGGFLVSACLPLTSD